MDVLPTPTLEDLHLIIPGALRRELATVTISMTPDEYAIVQQHAAEKLTTERDHAIAQAATANQQVQQLSATNIELAQKVTGLEMQLDTGTSDALQVMKARLTALERQLTEKTDQLAAANKTINGQQVTNDKQSTMLKDALARLAKYEPGTPPPPSTIPAPPVVVPGNFAPTITKTKLANLAGVTITTGDKAPSDKEDNQTRDLMALAGDMGFNAVRWFMNLNQMRDQVTLLKQSSPLCLPAFARAHGLTPMLDTLDNLSLNLGDKDLKDYLDNAKLLGFTSGYFNDADQYRTKKDAAGKLVHPAGTIERLVKRVRDVAPDFILFASVTGSAKVTEYEPLFDFTECQAFGSLSEFKSFLKLPCDLLCIDGRRRASADYLRAMLEALLVAGKDTLFVYTMKDIDSLWLNMPETVAIYREFMVKWKLARTKITAQPA